MRKLIFSLMAVMLLAGSVLFAQDSEVNRQLGVYFDAISGNMIPQEGTGVSGPTGVFAGNEFELGGWYQQNFTSAPWLSFRLTLLAIVGQQGAYDGQEYLGLASTSWDDGFDLRGVRAKAAISIDGSGFGAEGLDIGLSVDTRTLVAAGLGYTLNFQDAGRLRFGTAVEFWANPVRTYVGGWRDGWATVIGQDNQPEKDPSRADNLVFVPNRPENSVVNVLDLFVISITYRINFAEMWDYSTDLGFRFGGAGALDPTQVADSEIDAIPTMYNSTRAWEQNFASGFRLRWDNTIGVNIDGLRIYGRVRYDVDNLVAPSNDATGRILRRQADGTIREEEVNLNDFRNVSVIHNLSLRAGISYAFNGL